MWTWITHLSNLLFKLTLHLTLLFNLQRGLLSSLFFNAFSMFLTNTPTPDSYFATLRLEIVPCACSANNSPGGGARSERSLKIGRSRLSGDRPSICLLIRGGQKKSEERRLKWTGTGRCPTPTLCQQKLVPARADFLYKQFHNFLRDLATYV